MTLRATGPSAAMTAIAQTSASERQNLTLAYAVASRQIMLSARPTLMIPRNARFSASGAAWLVMRTSAREETSIEVVSGKHLCVVWRRENEVCAAAGRVHSTAQRVVGVNAIVRQLRSTRHSDRVPCPDR